ncbi:RhaT [Desulforapulum autotrophicum HRM2]|jgi:drug/metabolite transporter (DMT)-like permease|uniref:RhaT n=1 Tax=Desulforapulum autotrophicum (strain ATCC 43914 / DSM 3382 / VKM B-1955 / HRM2) TaxID=177437 RepID=C0Q9A7_DESAH|nr:DMT family transporter [Desulforapulum autotrophicum]ACN16612.1 RhaT [Desulforapulum autotrophicum HRM2]
MGSLTAIHLAVVLFGFAGLFGKFLTCTPLVIVFGRTAFAALALLPLVLASKANPLGEKTPRLKVYILQGVLLAVHWCTFFLSIQISTVALGLLTFSTFPLFTTLLEPFFFKQQIKQKDLVMALIVFAGLILVLPSFDFSQKPAQGAVWGTVSGFTFALLAIFNKKNLTFEPPVRLAFFQNLFAAATILPIFIFVPQTVPAPGEIILIATLGIVFTALAHTLFISSLEGLRATTVSIITCLEPLYGIILAALLLHEIPGLRMVAGGTIIVLSTLFASLNRKHSQ